LNKRKILERALAELVAVLTEETKRFVCNKREAHQFSSDGFSNLVASPQCSSIDTIDD
jgi:hypothetical protein